MVDYEWDIETWFDDEPDYHDFHDRLSEFDPNDVAEALSGSTKKLVLVRTSSEDRSWAYVENGTLPRMLSDAYGNAFHKVPSAYIREFKKVRR